MEDRVGRELKRYVVAARMVSHEARTQTICAYTGLTREKTKTLRKGWNVGTKRRHRGPSPTSLKAFFRSARVQNEASCIAAYCRILGAVTVQRIENAVRFFPNLTRGERLCDVFEAYRTLFPKSELNFEQTVLIAVGLAQGDVIELDRCSSCPRTTLIDRLAIGGRFCCDCRSSEGPEGKKKI
jgi:hypothetical protein